MHQSAANAHLVADDHVTKLSARVVRRGDRLHAIAMHKFVLAVVDLLKWRLNVARIRVSAPRIFQKKNSSWQVLNLRAQKENLTDILCETPVSDT